MNPITTFVFLSILCLHLVPHQTTATIIPNDTNLVDAKDTNLAGAQESNLVGAKDSNLVGANANDTNLVGANHIDKVCGLTSAKDLCISSLKSDPKSLDADDPKMLAIIAMRVASRNATDIAEHAKKLVDDFTLPPKVEQALSDCYETYTDAIDQIDDSVAAILAGAYNDVETWLKAAIAASNTCEASLVGNETLLLNKNKIFRQLCENALVICQQAAASDGKPE